MKYISTILTCLFSVIVMAQEKSLFNGEDLTGWTIYGTEKWYVEDGLLVSESGPDAQYGYLATDEPYKDFEVTSRFPSGSRWQQWGIYQILHRRYQSKWMAGRSGPQRKTHRGGL